MKKKFTFLMASLMLLLNLFVPVGMWGQEKPSTSGTLDMTTSQTSPVNNNNVTFTWTSDHIITGASDQNANGFKGKDGTADMVVTIPSGKKLVGISKVNGNNWGTTNINVYTGTSSSGTLVAEISKGTNSYTISANNTGTSYYFVTSESKNAWIKSLTIQYEDAGGGSTYSVTYNANGATSGSVPTDAISPYANGATVTVLGNTGSLAKTGHTFNNWNTLADGSGNPYSEGNTFTISLNTTLFAQWTVNTHTITLSGTTTHGTVGGFTNPVAYGTEVTLTYTTLEEYYATYTSSDVTITDGVFTMPDTDVTITVTENELPKYTVTYSDGGSETEASYGAGVTLATRPGNATYTFAGWSATNIPSETTTVPTIIPTNATYHPTSDITLYPVYTRTEGSGFKWVKTVLSDVTEGTYALITTDGHAFNGTISKGHGQTTTNAFSFTNNETTTAPDGVCELTLTILNNTQFKMYNSSNGYLYASAASSGNLAWHNSETSYWKLSSSNWVYNANSAYLRSYDNSSFRTYSSSSNGDVLLMAKKVSNTTTYYVSVLSSVSVPSFDPIGQNFSTATLSVTISVSDGCFICYTTDNTDPESSSTAILTDSNSETVTVTGTTTIRALAFDGDNYSSEVSQTYTRVYEVTLSSNGVAGDPIEVVSGLSTTLPTPSTVPSGYSFIHWTATPETPDTPVSNIYTPTANITLYAVYGKNTYGNFEKVTSSLDDYSGNYLIVYNNNYALNTHNGNVNADTYATYTDISDYYSVINNVHTITYNETTAGLIVVAAKTTNGYSLYDTDGYLGDNSSGTGSKLRWNTEFTVKQDEWTLGVNSIVNVKNMSNAIRWNNNNGQYRFAIYTTDGQQAIMLYKLKVTSIDGFYIQAYPTNSTTTATANIIISGKTVIESGATLNMGSYTLANGTAANLIIEDGGQLIVHNDKVQATIQKTVSVPSKTATNWYTIASPVRNVNIGAVGDAGSVNNLKAAGGEYDLYRFNETKDDVGTNLRWENYKNSAYHDGGADDFTSLESGRGYLYRREGTATLEYIGEVNGSEYETCALTIAGAAPLTGFHLIGNPYSHDIYKGAGAAIDDSKLNEGFYRLTNGTAWTSVYGYKEPIHSGEGILVQANDGGTLTISNSTTSASGESKYNNDNIMFSVSNSQHEDVAYAVFDKGHGLNKIEHRDANIPMLYISQNGEDYAIAMMSDDTKTFGLSLKATTMGQYTLKLKANGNYTYLHVIDRLTGEDVDMLLEDEYIFVASANDIRERFIVKLGYMPDYSDAENDVIAYQSGDQILVSGEGELQIFDVTGRNVMTTTINGVEAIKGLNNGVYIFKLEGKTQKIVVR